MYKGRLTIIIKSRFIIIQTVIKIKQDLRYNEKSRTSDSYGVIITSILLLMSCGENPKCVNGLTG